MIHCLHPTGVGVTLGNGLSGTTTDKCCHCGAIFQVNWRLEEREAEQHGPYHHESVRIRDEPTEDCPERYPRPSVDSNRPVGWGTVSGE